MAVGIDRVRAHVFVSGRVQNVNFRSHVRDEAKRAGVDGWARILATVVSRSCLKEHAVAFSGW